MRPYLIQFIFCLSLLLPLQVAAGLLLAEPPCADAPAMSMNMASDAVAMSMDAVAMETTPDAQPEMHMPCCPEMNHNGSANSPPLENNCDLSQFCHLCKTPGSVLVLQFATGVQAEPNSQQSLAPTQVVGSFNPASIWRPPNAS